ncbi:MAG: Na+/H+ antiporter NhaA [Alphaproteobacteria bacterium PA4]|nr:MAG: Na+/H+ antiporter NhaA [Alphaproteobacteria bacterium PA4]
MTPRRPLTAIRHLLHTEAAGGYVLMAAAALAMLVANSPWSAAYGHALHVPVAGLSLLHWINDGLMALFFLLVGLEVKRELVDGELSSWPRRILPGAAALGGMIAPALIYLAINRNHTANLSGWAIPAATDIAFALGVLALLGSRVPASLKLLLTAIAIIDDLGAILIIAIAYTDSLNLPALAAAAAGLAMLVACNRRGVQALWPYLLVGAGVWFAVLQSGIHATLAGVAVAFTIPLTRTRGAPEASESPLLRLEHALAPISAFLIVPIFGFANAGVDLRGLAPADAVAPVPLGIALGLLLGKQLGVFGAIAALVRAGVADAPAGASWRQLWGLSVLCGIGFTMSLFIAALAFGEGSPQDMAAKLGILAGSILSALAGWLILSRR